LILLRPKFGLPWLYLLIFLSNCYSSPSRLLLYTPPLVVFTVMLVVFANKRKKLVTSV